MKSEMIRLTNDGEFGEPYRLSSLKFISFDTSAYAISIWDLSKFEGISHQDIRETLLNLIKKENYKDAVEIILEEFLSYSITLARKFGKTLEDRSYIPYLFNDLSEEKIITEDEYNRLNALLLIVDGLDNEVKEYNGVLEPSDVEYLVEYIKILEEIMSKTNSSIELSKESTITFSYVKPQEYVSNIDSTTIDQFFEGYTSTSMRCYYVTTSEEVE